MPQLHAYLSFDGNCAEAMRFYERVLGARCETMIRFGDVADSCGPTDTPDRIMHAYLSHPEFALMAGDVPGGVPYAGVNGVMLALSYPSADEGRKVFDALAEGGQVTMPPAETFWAETFGMVTDRFGVPWGVNGGMKVMPTG